MTASKLATGPDKKPVAGVKSEQNDYLSVMEEGRIYEELDLDSTEATDTDEVRMCAIDKNSQ